MTDTPILQVDDLRVTYGAARAVDGVSLSVAAGEIVALLGPNGAGKSSILRAVSGLGQYDGAITFDGRSTRRRSVEALARHGLVHVPEGRRIFAPLTVAENLAVAATASAGRRHGAWTLDDVFELFPPLAPLRERRGWMLSGGEQQMLAIGRALVAAPRLLLLDEPSLGLAPRFVRAVFEALVRIAATVPMLVVEQNTAVALDVASRGYVISSGRIVMEGSAAELAQHASALDRCLGRTDASQA